MRVVRRLRELAAAWPRGSRLCPDVSPPWPGSNGLPPSPSCSGGRG